MSSSVSTPQPRVAHFPISFFAMIMALAGFTIATKKVMGLLSVSADLLTPIYSIFSYSTSILFIIVSVLYLTKTLRFFSNVKHEWESPVKLAFFPTISISFLLLSIVFLDTQPEIAFYLWSIGSTFHVLSSIIIIGKWIFETHFKIQHLTPAWFIPAVGNLLVPLSGVEFGYIHVSWFFFSVGLIFWIILFTLVFYRIVFYENMAKKLSPTLFIFIAPPAVAFIAFIKLSKGQLSEPAYIFYYLGLFLTILLLSQFYRFKNIPFFLSWWAYCFPLSAFTISSVLMFNLTQLVFFKNTAFIMMIILLLFVLTVSFKTILAIKSHGICIPEE